MFARTTFGDVLAGLATVRLLLAVLVLVSPGQSPPPGALFVLPTLYLGYYFRARGMLKVETRVLTGMEADRDNWKNDD